MLTFKDRENREWEVKLDVGMIEDIKDETGVDLDDLMKEKSKMSEMIFAETRKLVEIMYVICKEQINKIPLTPREFAKGFDRQTLDSASDAFLNALILFYPRTSAGKVLAEEFPQMILKMDAEITRKTKESVKKVLFDTVTDLPES